MSGPAAPSHGAPHPQGSPASAPQAPRPSGIQAPTGHPGTAHYPGPHPSHPPAADPGRASTGSPLAAVAGHLRNDRTRSSEGITPLGWAWRGAALFAISVVSGLLWLLIKPDGGDPAAGGTSESTKPPEGRYEFTTKKWVQGLGTGNCSDVSTGKIAEYFEEHPCEHLTRALYTTTLPNGDRVLTSVVTAKMANGATASQLEQLTTRSGTGNIEDLVSAGRPVPDEYPDLDGDLGYASQQQGRLVVIGESAYFRHPDRDDARLRGVTLDALRLGHSQDKRPR